MTSLQLLLHEGLLVSFQRSRLGQEARRRTLPLQLMISLQLLLHKRFLLSFQRGRLGQGTHLRTLFLQLMDQVRNPTVKSKTDQADKVCRLSTPDFWSKFFFPGAFG